MILTFKFLFMYSPNEPVYFLYFFTSWIWIQEANLYADPDPKHWPETFKIGKKNKLSKQTAEARAGAENLGHLPRDLGCPVFTVHLRILLSCRAA